MNFIIDHCCWKVRFFNWISSTEKTSKKHFQLTDEILPEDIHPNHPILKTNDFVNSSFYSSLNSSIHPSASQPHFLLKNVILTRSSLSERLGLTLCYGLTADLTTNIYIQDIDENSLADRQGDLRKGDQIIEINSECVSSRDRAMELVRTSFRIDLKILRFEHFEDDSGVIIPSPTTDLDTTQQQQQQRYCIQKFERNLSSSLSCLNLSIDQCYFPLKIRYCSSLNDLRSSHLSNDSIDYENAFLKPLPYQSNGVDQRHLFLLKTEMNRRLINSQTKLKSFRRRCREQRLKEQYQTMLTTDEETLSEFKQGKYWTREERKKHLIKSKENRQKMKFVEEHKRKRQSNPMEFSSPTDDFHLLNRIFLRENQREFQEKPHLAKKFYQQSLIEKENLKKFIQKNHFRRISSRSSLSTISHSTFQPQTSKTLFI